MLFLDPPNWTYDFVFRRDSFRDPRHTPYSALIRDITREVRSVVSMYLGLLIPDGQFDATISSEVEDSRDGIVRVDLVWEGLGISRLDRFRVSAHAKILGGSAHCLISVSTYHSDGGPYQDALQDFNYRLRQRNNNSRFGTGHVVSNAQKSPPAPYKRGEVAPFWE